jgi:hypothetical protein
MQEHGWGRVTGIDIEPNSIVYARTTYPASTFFRCDIGDVAKHVPDDFGLVTLHWRGMKSSRTFSACAAGCSQRFARAGRVAP